MECIQNEKSLKHRHRQTEVEFKSYVFSNHKPGLLLYVNVPDNIRITFTGTTAEHIESLDTSYDTSRLV